MSLITRNAILKLTSPILVTKRFRGKINIQRPRAPHFVKAKYLELVKPFYPKQKPVFINYCESKKDQRKDEVNNPFQRIIANELRDRMFESKFVAFFHQNPLPGAMNTKALILFKKNNMFIKQYGKETMKMAFIGTQYETVLDFFCSHNMLAFSKDGEIKKMLSIAKKFPQLIFLAGIYEGKLLNKDEILRYQNIPNIEAAQAEFVQTLNSIGNNIVSQLNTHPSNLISQLQERVKQLDDKKD